MVAIVAIPSAARMTPARQQVVWRLLVEALDGGPTPPSVLDCGGGTGSLAVPLAEFGAAVTVVDISVDALATLARRAAEAGVADRVRPVQGDIESLAAVVPDAGFDLVLAHGVLESLEDQSAALASFAAAARPGGLVSIVVGNPVASVLSRVLAGDVDAALGALQAQLEGRSPRLDAAALKGLCERAGLRVEQVHGLGVFADLAQGGDLSASAADTLARLEALAAATPPYRDIAARVHVLARRPAES